jgi:uncharacterized protein
MIQIFKIKDAVVLESIVNILMSEPGQMIDLSTFAAELGITRQTLSSYLGFLEESFFLRKLYNYSANRRKVERKLKKYYPTMASPDILFKDDDNSRSKAFEWFIVVQFGAEFFYRDSYKNEVDMILLEDNTAGARALPVEIKYGKLDYSGLLAFMQSYKIDEGLIISYNKEEIKHISGKKIRVVPAYKYLLEKIN